MSCTNNLKQMGLGLHMYANDNGAFPAGYNTANVSGWGTTETGTITKWEATGWPITILPYLEQGNVYNQASAYLDANPGQAGNAPCATYGFQMKTYRCPSDIRKNTGWDNLAFIGSYLGVAGTVSGAPAPTNDGLLYAGSKVKLVSVSDGLSNTCLVGERPGTADQSWGWTFAAWGIACESVAPGVNIQYAYGDGDVILGSRDVQVAVGSGSAPPTAVGLMPPLDPGGAQGNDIDVAHFFSFHVGSVNFLMGDGSVQSISYTANQIFPVLCTSAGGEVLTPAPF